MKAQFNQADFGNGARSLIVLGLAPLTSLNRSFLLLTESSHSQIVTVPLSTRTYRRLKRSLSAARSGRKHGPEQHRRLALQSHPLSANT